MSKRSFFAAILVIVAFPFAIVAIDREVQRHRLTDGSLTARFESHRPELERLAKAAALEKPGLTVTTENGGSPSKGLTPLLEAAGIEGLHIADNGDVFLIAESRFGLNDQTVIRKGFAYCLKPPKKVLGTLDNVRPTAQIATLYRKLSGNWYLYLECWIVNSD